MAGSPGSGRAKLRLSRGLSCDLAYDVTPTELSISGPRNSGIYGGHIARQDNAQSPGSDGASPYQRWVSHNTCGSQTPIGFVDL